MHDMNETNEVIMKTDRRGRLRDSHEQKQAFVEAFDSSGLSGPQFSALLRQPRRIPAHTPRAIPPPFPKLIPALPENLTRERRSPRRPVNEHANEKAACASTLPTRTPIFHLCAPLTSLHYVQAG